MSAPLKHLATPKEQDEKITQKRRATEEDPDDPSHPMILEDRYLGPTVEDWLEDLAQWLVDEIGAGYNMLARFYADEASEDTHDWGYWAFSKPITYDNYED